MKITQASPRPLLYLLAAATEAKGDAAMPAVAMAAAPPTCLKKSALWTLAPPAGEGRPDVDMVNAFTTGSPSRRVASTERYVIVLQERKSKDRFTARSAQRSREGFRVCTRGGAIRREHDEQH